MEPVGRRVRLTPAGRRLAEHAVTILAAVDAARRDLDPGEEPHGVVRVAGFATAIRRSLLPVVAELAATHPGIEVRLSEYEPLEAVELLGRDDIDLALVYDYTLTPLALRTDMVATELWSLPWGLGVPLARARPAPFSSYADRDWIVNSRNTADEDALRTLASMAGFTPRIVHRIDSLELVEDLIVSGHGIGLLPRGRGDAARRARAPADRSAGGPAGLRRRPAADASSGRRCACCWSASFASAVASVRG